MARGRESRACKHKGPAHQGTQKSEDPEEGSLAASTAEHSRDRSVPITEEQQGREACLQVVQCLTWRKGRLDDRQRSLWMKRRHRVSTWVATLPSEGKSVGQV